ncbi:ribonuclease HI family protein [Gracilibacillus alcaliphilus]|uniref:ribonuclease HI family protein n=1 Tax=Gracilibacillus alcaliphilus TaxID=1401441 RepID=UPI00195BC974|nr:ribonuclease HI family protein [Gracilibacillus alcaliphilus]MBM7675233.1 ribonuclease HI [Gracilibacillus alcaliphilus]
MIEVYTDAATKGNPGPSGIGIYLKQDSHQIEESHYIGEYTNHEAEFIAVLQALQLCQQQFPGEIISCRTDSKVVVETMEKNHTKNKFFLPYLEQINEISASFPYVFFKWISDKQNKHADMLARAGLAKRT